MPRHLPPPPDAHLNRRHWLALAGSASLTACGGGTAVDPQALPTVHPLGVATGGTGRVMSFLSATVSATAPVVVGGVTLATRDAEITDGDGNPLRIQQVAAGMTARVLAGSIVAGSAQAARLTVDTQLAGPANWLDSRTLVVLGQRVTVGSTVVRGPGAAGTPPQVQVWGQLDLAGGRIIASRLAVRPAAVPAMLRGLLSGVDRGAGWVQVGALVARARDGGAIASDLLPGAVARLTLGQPLPDGSWELLQARDDALRPPDGLHTELEGHVTQFTSATQFALDGVPVDASHAQIDGLAQLQPGAAVEVHGTMRGGVLVATEVAAQAAEPLELAGRITGLDAPGQSFIVQGRTVRWDATTRFSRGSGQDLRLGRTVAVRARWRPGESSLLAQQIALE